MRKLGPCRTERSSSLTAGEAALLLTVRVNGELSMSSLSFASQKAQFEGGARVSGRDPDPSIRLSFGGSAEGIQKPYSPPSGGEVVAEALREAIQHLADECIRRREALEDLARGASPG